MPASLSGRRSEYRFALSLCRFQLCSALSQQCEQQAGYRKCGSGNANAA